MLLTSEQSISKTFEQNNNNRTTKQLPPPLTSALKGNECFCYLSYMIGPFVILFKIHL